MSRNIWLWLLLLPFSQVLAQPAVQPLLNPVANDYVLDVTVINERQLDALLDRAERLQTQFSPLEHGRIEVFLHGPELNLVAGKGKQQNVIERLRLLDNVQGVDIKACQTMLRSLHLPETELPDFIQPVPFAPVEIQNLLSQGYKRL